MMLGVAVRTKDLQVGVFSAAAFRTRLDVMNHEDANVAIETAPLALCST